MGKTVQTIPHITNEIKRCIRLAAQQSGAEVLIVEIGGTVGDIEGLPFLEAIRQMRIDVGRDRVMYVHVTLLPHLNTTGELKTKPTQHSVKELRSIGIQPDAIAARSEFPIGDDLRAKIALFTDVAQEAVVPLVTADTIYAVPLELEEAGLGRLITAHFGLPERPPDLDGWRDLVRRIREPKPVLPIVVVGKYVQLPDAYRSIREALGHAGLEHKVEVIIDWLDSEDLERGRGWERLRQAAGIIVPGGFGHRGVEGKIAAARYAREHGVPYLGLCLGLQVMVIELARLVVGNDEPNSTEFDPHTRYPVIALLPEQVDVTDKGGTMRLGAWPCRILPGTLAHRLYGRELVHERHRHRFEVNPAFGPLLEEGGLTISGVYTEGDLVDIAELPDHRFMIGCQFHPEFKSRPLSPHPLFVGFVGAAVELAHQSGLLRSQPAPEQSPKSVPTHAQEQR